MRKQSKVKKEEEPLIDARLDENIELDDICDFKSRSIYIYGNINNILAVLFSKAIRQLEAESDKEIFIFINSFGGLTHSGASIITDIMQSACTVRTIVMGVAYSTAADILLAGDLRAMSQFGLLMYHMPSLGGVSENETINRTSEYIKYVSENLEELMKELLRETKVSKKKFMKRILEGDWYLNPKEAKKLGIVHEII